MLAISLSQLQCKLDQSMPESRGRCLQTCCGAWMPQLTICSMNWISLGKETILHQLLLSKDVHQQRHVDFSSPACLYF